MRAGTGSSAALEHRWDRSALALVAASFATLGGTTALTTAVGKHVYDISHRELDLGLVGLAEFAPALALIVLTGTIADRRSRKRVNAAALAAQAVVCGGMWLYARSGPTAVGPIFAIMTAFGVARAFSSPAGRALIADVAGPERLQWLIPRRSAVVQASLIVGPVLGGSLYAVDPTVPYLVAGAMFLGSSGLMLAIQPRAIPLVAPATATSRLHDTLEGFRFIKRNQVLLGAIGLDLFAVFFGGAVALLPAIAEERLGVGAVGFGWLRGALGIGAAAVTLVLTRRPVRRHVGRTLLVSVAVFGVCALVLGATTSYAVAFVSLLVMSGADAVSVFIRSTLVPLVTPAPMRGRVSAVEMVFIGATNELGAFESGVTGELFGPAPAVVLGGVATIAVAGVWWTRFDELRDVDEFPRAAA